MSFVKKAVKTVVGVIRFVAENGEEIKDTNKKLFDITIRMNESQVGLAKTIISVIDGEHIKQMRDALVEYVEVSDKLTEKFLHAVFPDDEEGTSEDPQDNPSADVAQPTDEHLRSKLKSKSIKPEVIIYDITDGKDDERENDMNMLVSYIKWVSNTYEIPLNDKMKTNVDILRTGRYVARNCSSTILKHSLESKLKNFAYRFQNIVVSRIGE
jgi:hypothetical protein